MPLVALQDLDPRRFETAQILKQCNLATRSLAELKGVIATIPQQAILINTLGMQEAKESSAIENIVTTHDDLYREDAFPDSVHNFAAKEVYRYRQALSTGFEMVSKRGLITINNLIQVQEELGASKPGIRTMPGTELRNERNETVYIPPQDHAEILRHLSDLESFINEDSFDADPLIKMALIHHQFESIHPFYDGNGRTGRILNVLYLVKEGLLKLPVLYSSRQLLKSKGEYYRLLQAVREKDEWEAWVFYMLSAVEASAMDAIVTTEAIAKALLDAKHRIRDEHRFYSQDLINTLFSHPYTKIEFVMNSLGVSRGTATKYLEALANSGIVEKVRVGRSNYFVNKALWPILAGANMQDIPVKT